MRVQFTENGWRDFTYWIATDKRMTKEIVKLIEAITRDPYEGGGRPEQLKRELSVCWSRRIDQEHRLVYAIDEESQVCSIITCRKHY